MAIMLIAWEDLSQNIKHVLNIWDSSLLYGMFLIFLYFFCKGISNAVCVILLIVCNNACTVLLIYSVQ